MLLSLRKVIIMSFLLTLWSHVILPLNVPFKTKFKFVSLDWNFLLRSDGYKGRLLFSKSLDVKNIPRKLIYCSFFSFVLTKEMKEQYISYNTSYHCLEMRYSVAMITRGIPVLPLNRIDLYYVFRPGCLTNV